MNVTSSHMIRFGFIVTSFSLALMLTISGNRTSEGERGENTPGQSNAMDAFQWWYGQRALPFDRIPKGALQRAANHMKSKMKKERRYGADAANDSAWISIGPRNVGGRVLAIAVNPKNSSIVWAGSASGGLWKSTTAGEGLNAWTHINTGFPALSISAIAIDTANPNIMYVGTGEISFYHFGLLGLPGARASYGLGILKSTDAGASWDTTGLSSKFTDMTAIHRIVINPRNSRTLFAATSEGVFKSTNAGTTWSLSNPELMAMDVVLNPTDTTILIASHGSLNSTANPGMYISVDAGDSWNKVENGLPLTDFGRTALAISISNPSVVYAGVASASSGSIIGLFKTTNSGTSWTNIAPRNYAAAQGWYNNVVAVDPTAATHVYAGGFDVYESNNGGSNLAAISSGQIHVDHHAITFDPADPSIMYFGCDGGMYKSTDGGGTFMDINNGFVTTQFYPGLSMSYTDSLIGLGGLQDNGTLRYHGQPGWDGVNGGDGGWTAIDPTNKQIMYAESQFLAIGKSTNGGFSFIPATNGLPIGASNTNFIPPFVLSPSHPNILYAGAKHVYKSTNAAGTWFTPSGSSSLNGTKVSCIGVSYTSADTLMTGTGSSVSSSPIFKIYATTNGGTVWTDVTGPLPSRYPTDIEFDPSNSAVAYVTYSGYLTSHVFKTTNVGNTWIDITSNLPDLPCQAIVVDPKDPSTIWVGTDLGIFMSKNGGGLWEDFSSGMPQAMVLDLVFSRSNHTLRAATFGNGVYERRIPSTPSLAVSFPNGGESWTAGTTEMIRWSSHYISTVDIEYSTASGSGWIPLASGLSAYTGSYAWVISSPPTTDARVRVKDSQTGTTIDSSDSPFTILAGTDVVSGWNLVSVHLNAPDMRKTILYPAATSEAFAYINGYVQKESLATGVGYWLKFGSGVYHSFAGVSVVVDTIDVVAGWNLIGAISAPVSTSTIVQIPPSIVNSPFYGFQSSYVTTTTLESKKGYWVKANADGKLILSSSANVPSLTLPKNPLRALPSLTINDTRGNKQELYISEGMNRSTIEYYELPPMAPHGFDARFGSGRMVESTDATAADATYPLRVKSDEYPIKLAWNLSGSDKTFSLIVRGTSVRIEGEGNVLLSHDETVGLALHVGPPVTPSAPKNFSLQQNYPNPFNPATELRFSLPVTGRYSLNIYNIEGALVATIVDGFLEAGDHSYRWDASMRANGLYFAELRGAPGTQTRKMLLIK